MLAGFKAFVLRGNVVDLAVAVVMGAAFGAVVTSVVDNIVTPLIAAIFGAPSLAGALTFTVNNAVFSIGAVLDAVITFVLVAAAVYVVIVLPLNTIAARRAAGDEPDPVASPEDVVLLREIRDLLAARADD